MTRRSFLALLPAPLLPVGLLPAPPAPATPPPPPRDEFAHMERVVLLFTSWPVDRPTIAEVVESVYLIRSGRPQHARTRTLTVARSPDQRYFAGEYYRAEETVREPRITPLG